MIYWGVELFISLYVKAALLYFNRFTISSLNIPADGVLKFAYNITKWLFTVNC